MSHTSQLKHFIFVIVIISICVWVVFMLFTTEVSAKIYINYRVNPPNVECDALLEAYSYKELLYMAALEYFYL